MGTNPAKQQAQRPHPCFFDGLKDDARFIESGTKAKPARNPPVGPAKYVKPPAPPAKTGKPIAPAIRKVAIVIVASFSGRINPQSRSTIVCNVIGTAHGVGI